MRFQVRDIGRPRRARSRAVPRSARRSPARSRPPRRRAAGGRTPRGRGSRRGRRSPRREPPRLAQAARIVDSSPAWKPHATFALVTTAIRPASLRPSFAEIGVQIDAPQLTVALSRPHRIVACAARCAGSLRRARSASEPIGRRARGCRRRPRYLADCGIAVGRRRNGCRDGLDDGQSLRAARADGRRRAALPLRPSRHRAADRCDRARRRGRRRPQRRRNDPRRRQQGRGGGHARRGPARAGREPPSRRDRAALHRRRRRSGWSVPTRSITPASRPSSATSTTRQHRSGRSSSGRRSRSRSR